MSVRIPKPRESEPGHAGTPSCGWGHWIEHDGGERPEFVRISLYTMRQGGRLSDTYGNNGRADPVDYIGTRGLRGTGRNLSPDWDRIRWFRLRADHPHYSEGA